MIPRPRPSLPRCAAVLVATAAALSALTACGGGPYFSLEVSSIGTDPGAPIVGKADADEGTVTVTLSAGRTVSCLHNPRTSTFTCATGGLEPGVWEVTARNDLDGEVLILNCFVAVGAGQDYQPALFTDAKEKGGRAMAKHASDVTWRLTGWHPNDEVVVSFTSQSQETGKVDGTAPIEVSAATDPDGNATVTADVDLAPGWWQVDATDGLWTMSRHNGHSPTLVIEE